LSSVAHDRLGCVGRRTVVRTNPTGATTSRPKPHGRRGGKGAHLRARSETAPPTTTPPLLTVRALLLDKVADTAASREPPNPRRCSCFVSRPVPLPILLIHSHSLKTHPPTARVAALAVLGLLGGVRGTRKVTGMVVARKAPSAATRSVASAVASCGDSATTPHPLSSPHEHPPLQRLTPHARRDQGHRRVQRSARLHAQANKTHHGPGVMADARIRPPRNGPRRDRRDQQKRPRQQPTGPPSTPPPAETGGRDVLDQRTRPRPSPPQI